MSASRQGHGSYHSVIVKSNLGNAIHWAVEMVFTAFKCLDDYCISLNRHRPQILAAQSEALSGINTALE